MKYLYGIALPTGPRLEAVLSGLAGVTGPVEVMPVVGSIGLIAGPHSGGAVLPARRKMLAHAKVLEVAMTASTILPMSFGTIAEDPRALVSMLRAEADSIARRVTALRGLQEFGLRIAFPKDEALAALLADQPALAAERDRLAAGGTARNFAIAELGRRVAEALVARRDAAGLRLAAALAPLARDMVIKPPEEDIEVFRAEVLLEAGAEDAFAEAALRTASTLGFAGPAEASVRLVGPVPPFHFADLALGAGRDAA